MISSPRTRRGLQKEDERETEARMAVVLLGLPRLVLGPNGLHSLPWARSHTRH